MRIEPEAGSSYLTVHAFPDTFVPLKSFVSILLLLGLMSPLCLCGQAVSQAHGVEAKAATCSINHTHEHSRMASRVSRVSLATTGRSTGILIQKIEPPYRD